MAREKRSYGYLLPRRIEKYFLTGLVIVALVTVVRLPQLKHTNSDNSSIIRQTVVSTRQVTHSADNSLQQPGQTLTVVIDSTTAGSGAAAAGGALPAVTVVPGATQRVGFESFQQAAAVRSGAEDAGSQASRRELDDPSQHKTQQQQQQQHQLAQQQNQQLTAQQQQQQDAATGLAASAAAGDAGGMARLAAAQQQQRQQQQPELTQQQQQQQQQPVQAAEVQLDSQGVPMDFDWQAYLVYHPDIREAGIDTEDAARSHYLRLGRSEGRVYKRLRLILRYTACTGLTNQLYSHLAAFALAAVLGAEVVLPPAVFRDSFAKHFSVFREQNEVKWSSAPTETLMDVDAIVSHWRDNGIVVHKCPGTSPFPDLTDPYNAYPMYYQQPIAALGYLDPDRTARLYDVYLANLELNELVERVRATVMGRAAEWLTTHPGRDVDYIALDLPCTFFMIRTISSLPLVGQVARSLEFAPPLRALAQRVVDGVTRGGARQYNAIHLRVEKDAKDWSMIMGGEAVIWQGYVEAMSRAGFSSDVPLYVASGLLTYGATDDMRNTEGVLSATGMCSEIAYKEQFIPQQEIDALNSEQKALLDFLVLAQGKAFVGFGSSTFSFYLREMRALRGVPKHLSVLVDASVIGTDPLFNSAGTLMA